MEEPDAGEDVARSFAIDELLGREVGSGGAPVCHLWRHPKAFVIGTKDARLPGAAEAASRLQAKGYSVLVRHSGGAAVPLDSGVVNLSLVLPIPVGNAQDYRSDFERMYVLIRRALSSYGVRADRGEVKGSYCPGDYDLSVDGLKLCGIAQRRQLRAMIIQAFVIVEGSGAERAQLVREFYDLAGAGAGPEAYPAVRPDAMTSLAERSPTGPATAEAFSAAIVRALTDLPGGTRAMKKPLLLPDDSAVAETCGQLRARFPLF